MRRRVVVALLWLTSLLLVATVARAQRGEKMLLEPEVISGEQIGFRIDRYDGETPVGELVVRRNGKWVSVAFGARIKPMR